MRNRLLSPAETLKRSCGQLRVTEQVDLRDLSDADFLQRFVALPDLQNRTAFTDGEAAASHVQGTKVIAGGHQPIIARTLRPPLSSMLPSNFGGRGHTEDCCFLASDFQTNP